MSTYHQLYVPPVIQRKSCCEECSLCYCRCCLSISVVLAIIFTVAGGLLVYNFRKDKVEEFGEYFGVQDGQKEFLRILGYTLLVLGSIMVLCIFISASCVCCLTSSPVNRPGAVVISQSAGVVSSPHAPIPVPGAPIEPPPPYESINQEKV
nr:expressed conserved protein [Hymenolepis microstoma]